MSYRHKHIRPKIRSLKKKKRLIQKPWFWIVSVILIIIIAILYLVLFYQKFQVKKINISGNQNIQSKDIENLIWLNVNKKILNVSFFTISTKSIFTVKSEKIVKDILKIFPSIENIEIRKKMPDNIILTIKEREPLAVFCPQSQSCFFIDKNGVIFEPLKSVDQDNIIIKSAQDNKFTEGENAISENIMDAISKIINDLKDNFQIDVKEIFVSNTLIFRTSENWKIYFDPTSDINLQITKMNILLKDEIPLNIRKNLQYIYLQYKDRAYYK